MVKPHDDGVPNMNNPAGRQASYEDLLNLPENLVGEILGGQLHTSPRPTPKHARAYSALGYLVGGPYDGGINGPGGWWIMDEPELHLNGDVLVPDLAGWQHERMPELPDTAYFELAPDWVCEILSPSTAQTDRSIKMPIYAREGVSHLWLVDPEHKILEAYSLGSNGLWALEGTLSNDAKVCLEPFNEITFSLAGLWV